METHHPQKLSKLLIVPHKEMSEKEKLQFVERCRFASKMQKFLESKGYHGRYVEYNK